MKGASSNGNLLTATPNTPFLRASLPGRFICLEATHSWILFLNPVSFVLFFKQGLALSLVLLSTAVPLL